MVYLDKVCFKKEDAYSEEVMEYFFSLPGSFGLGYFYEDKLIGFILCNKNHIITIDIHPEHRRKGLGFNLINFSISKIKKKGYTYISLEVDKENLPAIKLYEKIGFKIKKKYFEGKKERYFMVFSFFY